MSSIINYGLKRDYDTNLNEKMNRTIPTNLLFKTVNDDYVIEDKPLRQRLFFRQQNKYSYLNSQNDDYSKQDLIEQNQQNDQQSSHEINRYLKQYQYNYYKNSDIEVANKQSQNPFQQKSIMQKLSHKNSSAEKIIAKYQINQPNLFKCRDLFLYDKKKLQNLQNKENIVMNVQSLSDLHPYISAINLSKQNLQKQLSFIQKDHNIKNLISKEQIIVLKILREQNNQMKIEIDKKNLYIKELEVKIQRYLSDRVEIQQIQAIDIKKIQKKLQKVQIQRQSISKQLNNCQNQLQNYKRIFQRISYSCNISQTKIQKNANFDINSSQKINQFLQNHIFEITTFETFVKKIEEMKQKIDNPACHKQTHIASSSTCNEFSLNKQLNLNVLWKWLKKIGKQYEIMKQKVASFNQSYV